MSLECGECERDLRGGHASGCSRHPVNKNKKHPLHKPVQVLRKLIGKRDEHHSCCNSRKRKECDCYGKNRQIQHEALDEALDAIIEYASPYNEPL